MKLKALFLLLILSACSDGIPLAEKPEKFIPRKEMVEVLTEMTKLEAVIQTTFVSVDKYHNAMRMSGDSLLKAHGYTYEHFDQSMTYYGERQDEMISIYSDVLDELNRELGEIQSSK